MGPGAWGGRGEGETQKAKSNQQNWKAQHVIKFLPHLRGSKRNRFRSAKQTPTAGANNRSPSKLAAEVRLGNDPAKPRTLSPAPSRARPLKPRLASPPLPDTYTSMYIQSGPPVARGRSGRPRLSYLYIWTRVCTGPRGVIARPRRPRGRGPAEACPCPAVGCRRAAAAAPG